MNIKISGARETSQWLGRLQTELPKAIEKAIVSEDALSEMTQAARQIVNSVVYAVYDPKEYQRTFALLESVGAVKIQDSPPAAGIALELNVDTAANHGSGTVNYGIFMLPEFANTSWLQRTAPATLPRDFLTAWLQFFADQVPPRVSNAIQEALER